MQIPPDFLDEIRARINISDVVGRAIKLQKRGQEYIGLSPFNKEKTPSFTVNDYKGFYHCFSSGKHGDIFRFLMETEGLTFPEAVERLAGQAGLAVPQPTREEQVRHERRKDLYEVMDMACDWFQSQLSGPNGRVANDYFKRRGLLEKTIKSFRLGFSLDTRDALKMAMKAKGIDETQLETAGLIKRPEDGRPPFDYFRGRVMFPITDRNNRVIAFGARTTSDAQPKYLNSPDTELFHKGSVLYGISTARKAAFHTGKVLVCEGYMDVIGLAQVGISHAVAPLGTAITHRQIQQLWKMAPEPIVCLDGDKAGRRAARRTAERTLEILKPGHSLKFALMPEGEDPDSLVKLSGAAAIDPIIATATPLADVLIKDTLRNIPNDPTPECRAGLEKHLKELAFQIKDTTVKSYYLRYFKDRLYQALSSKRQDFPSNRSAQKASTGRRAEFRRTSWSSTESQLNTASRKSTNAWEISLVSIMIRYPEIIEDVAEEATHLRLTNQSLDSLLAAVLEASNWQVALDSKSLKAHLSETVHADTVAAIDGPQAVHSLRFDRTDKEAENPGLRRQRALKVWREVCALHRRTALERELNAAERICAEEPSETAWNRLVGLRKALQELSSVIPIE